MRWVRAMRLSAIKADIAERLDSPSLSVATIATRQRVSSRYVQMLFKAEGTTFTQFVVSERLARAHRMLSDTRLADRGITSVAIDVGFGDLSYFNRTFRRRFGNSPSDVRTAAREAQIRSHGNADTEWRCNFIPRFLSAASADARNIASNCGPIIPRYEMRSSWCSWPDYRLSVQLGARV